MISARRVPLALVALAALVGCDETPVDPDPEPEPVRTVLFQRGSDLGIFLVNTDGTDRQRVTIGSDTDSLIPLAVAPGGAAVALLADNAILVSSLQHPEIIDTAFAPAPREMSLASFSPDQRFLGVVSYVPETLLLVYDRVNRRVDSFPIPSNPPPALPPVFDATGDRVALIGVTQLSAHVTLVQRDRPELTRSEVLGFSRVLSRPVFGWPTWTDEGILFAVLRVAPEAVDTILSVSINPDRPGDDLVERYRATMSPVSDQRPELLIGDYSTYSYSPGGDALILGAHPSTDTRRHALYLINRAAIRVQLVLDDPSEFPLFPLLIN